MISGDLSHSLGGTRVFKRYSAVQLEVCFDKQDSGKRRTLYKLCERLVATRSDTDIVSAGIWRRIFSGMLLSCWRPAINNASNPDDGSGSMSMTVVWSAFLERFTGSLVGVVKFARSVGL